MESSTPQGLDQPQAVPAVKVVCVYRTGGDYDADYVRRLAAGVHKHLGMPHDFICLSNDPEVAGVGNNLALRHDWPGWWAVMELYNIRGPALYFDLDTVIVGDITPLAQWAIDNPDDIASLRGFKGEWSATGVLAWGGDQSHIYDRFVRATQEGTFMGSTGLMVDRHRYASDQLFIDAFGFIQQRIQDFFPGVYSYKHHCKNGLPADANVVCFHGKPRPHELHPKPQ